MSDVDLKLEGLEKLLKALKSAPKVKLKVGILGGGARAGNGKGATPTNAQVGAWHEFGTSKLPVRSFLREPLSDNLNKYLEKSGAFTQEAADKVLELGSIKPWLEKVGILAEEVVSDAFSSGGFGKWAPHSPGYTNNTGMVLVDTQQLRDSITSKVEDG